MFVGNRFRSPFSLGFFGDFFLGLLAISFGTYFTLYVTNSEPLSKLFGLKVGIKAISLVIALIIGGTGRTVWRWTTPDDIILILRSVMMYGLIFTGISGLLYLQFHISLSSFEPFISMFLMATFMLMSRAIARFISSGGSIKGISALRRRIEKGAPPAILVGTTDVIAGAIHELRKLGPLPFNPLAIVSTAGNHINKVYAGALVYDGRKINEVLSHLCQEAKANYEDVRVILVGDDHGEEVTRAALNAVAKSKVRISRMPEFGSKILRNVNPAEILGRRRHTIDVTGPSKLIKHKSVLITGAGGTIGSEIAKQVAALSPAKLILIDGSENNLYSISQILSEEFPGLSFEQNLVDIRDVMPLNAIFDKHKPQIIIHAAANKHVPLLEAHPREAIRVNLGGTLNVLRAAERHDVEAFVSISTDKAVTPHNIMGAVKRAAELCVRKKYEEHKGKYFSVRFGNVLGSSGSVMPLFERQIAKGGPVTITHRDMTRWFMTVEEAVGLVLQGAAIGAGYIGDTRQQPQPLLVLDMGQPIKIKDFAETLIRLSGYEPYTQIPIVEIGSRPGEKLHEELFYQHEKVRQSEASGILGAEPTLPLDENLMESIELTLKLAKENKIDAAIAELKKIVPEYTNFNT